MTKSQELTVPTNGLPQLSLDGGVFSRFVNLKVGLSLTGSETLTTTRLEELCDEPLQRGREVTVTARFLVQDLNIPIAASTDYQGNLETKLGNGKVGLRLLGVQSIEVGRQLLQPKYAVPCSCLITKAEAVAKNAEDRESDSWNKPYRVDLDSPLERFGARRSCETCRGSGLELARASSAPHAPRVPRGYNETVILVDVLPEPPAREPGTPECCGVQGHHHNCPEYKAEMDRRRCQSERDRAAASPAPEDGLPCHAEGFTEGDCEECERVDDCDGADNPDLRMTAAKEAELVEGEGE